MIKSFKEVRAEAIAKNPPKLKRLSSNINFMMRAARDRNSPNNPNNKGQGGRGRPNR